MQDQEKPQTFSYRRTPGTDRDALLTGLEDRLGLYGTELFEVSIYALMSLVLHYESKPIVMSVDENGNQLPDDELLVQVKIGKQKLDAALEYLGRNGMSRPIRWARKEVFIDTTKVILRELLAGVGVKLVE